MLKYFYIGLGIRNTSCAKKEEFVPLLFFCKKYYLVSHLLSSYPIDKNLYDFYNQMNSQKLESFLI